jgi:hypothetical protein
MIDKSTCYEEEDGNWVLEFPELETVNLGDLDIQRQLIKWGMAVGVPGSEFVVIKSVRLVALKGVMSG